jgi:succinyl-diaminopimelate desuccinylase
LFRPPRQAFLFQPMTLTAEANRLLKAAEGANDEAVRLLSELIQFPTVNSRETPEEIAKCRAAIKDCFAYLERWAGENGFVFRNYDDLVCALEIPGETDETVGVALHMDVVPVPGQWKHGPFSGEIADGCVWGRGAQDDKGPSAQCLIAAKLIKDAGIPFKRTLKFIVGSTEETAEWECVERFLKEEPDPDFTMVPDAEFPIISGEKGFVTLLANARWGADALPERPGGLRLVSVMSGKAENIVPDHAEIICVGKASHERRLAELVELFSRGRGRTAFVSSEAGANEGEIVFHIKILGRAAHSSLPHLGVNAAVDALELMTMLFGEGGSPAASAADWLFQVCRDSTGKGLGVAASHPFVGDTTVSLTTLNLDAKGLSTQINVRCAMGQSTAEVVEQARANLAEYSRAPEVSIEPKKGFREPIYVDADEFGSYMEALRNSYEDVQGRPAKLLSVGGTTFSKAFKRAVCFGAVDKADGEPELAHQVNERVKVEHCLRNLKIYTLALARLVSANPDL